MHLSKACSSNDNLARRSENWTSKNSYCVPKSHLSFYWSFRRQHLGTIPLQYDLMFIPYVLTLYLCFVVNKNIFYTVCLLFYKWFTDVKILQKLKYSLCKLPLYNAGLSRKPWYFTIFVPAHNVRQISMTVKLARHVMVTVKWRFFMEMTLTKFDWFLNNRLIMNIDKDWRK